MEDRKERKIRGKGQTLERKEETRVGGKMERMKR